jgi:hypothetical protein
LGKGNIVSIGILAVNTRGYLNTYAVYAESKLDLFRVFTSALGGYNRKKERPWALYDISYMILKRQGDANREGNSITNTLVTRGP